MKSTYDSFFRPIQPLSREGDVVILGVSNRFAREWLEKRYGSSLRSMLATNLGAPDLHIRFVISAGEVKPALGDADAVGATPPESETKPAPSPRQPKSRAQHVSHPAIPAELTLPLNPRLTFANFVVGRNNLFAAAGAEAVANSPGVAYNPLFLYGGYGLGKTHLLQAIAHRILDEHPGVRIAYISGESFMNGYIAALRDKRSEEFRAVYRSIDVFLVDDIQSIAGKEHTKEEFFHTFNTLHQLGKQIVLTSDRSPRELRMMDERLKSRFECGLIADVAPPDLEMRVAILHKKAALDGFSIADDVLLYMANRIQSNIRTLEGALTRLKLCAGLSNIPVTRQLASDVLEQYFVDSPLCPGRQSASDDCATTTGLRAMPLPPLVAQLNEPARRSEENFAEIVRVVAAHFGIAPAAIAGEGSARASRRKEAVVARQIAIYLARERTDLAVNTLAHLFGDVSHSAISHAHRKMNESLRSDNRILTVIQEIASELPQAR